MLLSCSTTVLSKFKDNLVMPLSVGLKMEKKKLNNICTAVTIKGISGRMVSQWRKILLILETCLQFQIKVINKILGDKLSI